LPRQTFSGVDLYTGIIAKSAALAVTLVLNGFELTATVDDAEAVVIAVASGRINRDGFSQWVEQHHQVIAF